MAEPHYPFDPSKIVNTDLETFAQILTAPDTSGWPLALFKNPSEKTNCARNVAAILASGVLPLLSQQARNTYELPPLSPTDHRDIQRAKESCRAALVSGEVTPAQRLTAIATTQFAAVLLQAIGLRAKAQDIRNWVSANSTEAELKQAEDANPNLMRQTASILLLDLQITDAFANRKPDANSAYTIELQTPPSLPVSRPQRRRRPSGPLNPNTGQTMTIKPSPEFKKLWDHVTALQDQMALKLQSLGVMPRRDDTPGHKFTPGDCHL